MGQLYDSAHYSLNEKKWHQYIYIYVEKSAIFLISRTMAYFSLLLFVSGKINYFKKIHCINIFSMFYINNTPWGSRYLPKWGINHLNDITEGWFEQLLCVFFSTYTLSKQNKSRATSFLASAVLTFCMWLLLQNVMWLYVQIGDQSQATFARSDSGRRRAMPTVTRFYFGLPVSVAN